MTDILEALVVRPGDTLIVRVRQGITPAELHGLKAAIEERMSGVEVAIIAAEQIAAHRPGGESDV